MTISNVNGLICDLVFGSQISEAVTAAGLNYKAFRSSADVATQLALSEVSDPSTLWIVNLAANTATEPELVEKVLPSLIAKNLTVICYAPHVEEQRMAWASGLGVEHVVPRGALIRTLGAVISSS